MQGCLLSNIQFMKSPDPNKYLLWLNGYSNKHQQSSNMKQPIFPEPNIPISNQTQLSFDADKTETAYYSEKLGDITKLKSQTMLKIFQNKKVLWTDQFALNPKITTLQYDNESIIIQMHCGNFLIQLSTIVTCLDFTKFKQKQFAKGNFGSIYQVLFDNREYVIKAISVVIKQGDLNLTSIYLQYFMCYLAGCVGAGPKVYDIMGYDIVVFRDEACFVMERCQNLDQMQYNISQISAELMQSLSVLHSIGLMHLDIKPRNIAFSKQLMKFVFIDFGFSKLVQEPLGRKTLTRFAGTTYYCSKQMKKLSFISDQKYIDLYFNDLTCLLNSLRDLNIPNIILDKFQLDNSCVVDEKDCSFSYFNIIFKVFQFKLFALKGMINKIVKLVHENTDISNSFYCLLTSEFLKGEIRQSPEIKSLIIKLKKILVQLEFKTSKQDAFISQILKLSVNLSFLHQRMSIFYILELSSNKFAQFLNKLENIHRLFLIFDPRSGTFPIKKLNKLYGYVNYIREEIISKVSRFVGLVEKLVRYQELRVTLVFFYEKLRILKNRQILFSLKFLFILIQEKAYSLLLDAEIFQLTEDVKERILIVIQFSLCLDLISNYYCKEKQEMYLGVINQIQTCGNDEVSELKYFAIQILNREKHKFREKLCQKRIWKLLEAIESKFTSYKGIIRRIKILYHLLSMEQVDSKMEQEMQTGFIQRLYRKESIKIKKNKEENNFDWLASKFGYLTIEISELQQTRHGFKKALKRLFKLSRSRKAPIANFVGEKEQSLLLKDDELLLFVLEEYQSLILSLQYSDQEQVFLALTSFLWLLKVGIKYERGRRNKEIILDQKGSIEIKIFPKIWELYHKFYNKVKTFLQQTSFKIMSLSLEGVLCIWLNEENCKDKIEKMVDQIRQQLNPIPYPKQEVIMFFIFLGKNIIEAKNEQIKKSVWEQIIKEITQKYVTQKELQIFECSSLLKLAIMVNNNQCNIWHSFSLIKTVVKFMNSKKLSFILNGIFATIKQAVNIFCQYPKLQQLIPIFEQLQSSRWQLLQPELLYLEFFIFLSFFLQSHRNAIVSQDIKLVISCCLPKQLVRISLSLRRMNRYLCSQCEKWIYFLHRNSFKFKSRRKSLLCLKREKQFKILLSKYWRTLKLWPIFARNKMQEKIGKFQTIL